MLYQKFSIASKIHTPEFIPTFILQQDLQEYNKISTTNYEFIVGFVHNDLFTSRFLNDKFFNNRYTIQFIL